MVNNNKQENFICDFLDEALITGKATKISNKNEFDYVKCIFSDSTPFTFSGEWELGMCDQQMEVFSNLLFRTSSNGVNKKITLSVIITS